MILKNMYRNKNVNIDIICLQHTYENSRLKLEENSSPIYLLVFPLAMKWLSLKKEISFLKNSLLIEQRLSLKPNARRKTLTKEKYKSFV
jgi:hypothetical protein